jgi:hypothetical protein
VREEGNGSWKFTALPRGGNDGRAAEGHDRVQYSFRHQRHYRMIVLYFFVDGISGGSVSSFNIGIWPLLLAGVAIPMVAGGDL